MIQIKYRKTLKISSFAFTFFKVAYAPSKG